MVVLLLLLIFFGIVGVGDRGGAARKVFMCFGSWWFKSCAWVLG
jgi:hypothetical protein